MAAVFEKNQEQPIVDSFGSVLTVDADVPQVRRRARSKAEMLTGGHEEIVELNLLSHEEGEQITGKRDSPEGSSGGEGQGDPPEAEDRGGAADGAVEEEEGEAVAAAGGLKEDTEPLLLADDECSLSASEEGNDSGAAAKQSVEGRHMPEQEESAMAIFLQVVFPFFVAGVGMVAAGLVLDTVQHWRVFTDVPEIFILVPALLGLKGNLEMTLASRLSTLANLGRMDTKKQRNRVIVANIALIQAQAVVVAFCASLFAIVLAWIPNGLVDWRHALLLSASSLTTASLASFVLGIIMVLVVVVSRAYHVNPDNVATPIAASLGDLTTLTVLATFGTIFLRFRLSGDGFILNGVVSLAFLLSAPFFMYLASKEEVTLEVLKSGWSPVLFAMLISSAGGFILKFAVRTFHGIAVFQPVINGVGGNLVAVQASRISTSLHRYCKLGKLMGHRPRYYLNPLVAFCCNSVESRVALVLLAMVVPGHLAFNYLIHVMEGGHTTISMRFTFVYLSAAVIQVIILLYVCQWMVREMWSLGVDPDNSAIPYLTALGDLLGTSLLALVFIFLAKLPGGDGDSDVGE